MSAGVQADDFANETIGDDADKYDFADNFAQTATDAEERGQSNSGEDVEQSEEAVQDQKEEQMQQ